MAGRGPAPKAQHQRARDTARRQAGAVVLEPDGELRGPELPEHITDPHPATVEWWLVWRRSPQASLFEDTDWETLKRAARLVDDVWKAPRASAAAISELRLIEERLGATVADRQRLRVSISRPDEGAKLAPVTDITSRASLTDRLRG